MFDQQKIQETLFKSKEEEWPYPEVFSSLKKAGVESYTVSLEKHKSTYRGGSADYHYEMVLGGE